MVDGATLVAPETVFLSWDTKLGRDVLIEPNVVIGPGVAIADGATIHAFSHLEGAQVAGAPSVGPFARLRPGADVAAKAKIGNFVEIKNAAIEAGAKVNHLSYIGDARVGAGREYRGGDDHLQLRRLFEIPDRHRRRRLHRLEFGAGRAGDDRRRRLCRVGLGHHERRRAGRARGRPRPAGDAPGWAKAFRDRRGK